MDTEVIQQEILFVTGTSFSQRQLSGRDGENESNNLSESEKLEKAIWDGLLGELLPEVITNKKLHIWQVGDTEFSLQIELSEYPSRERWSSVNPYYFLRTMKYN
jgi:hypothetical protein